MYYIVVRPMMVAPVLNRYRRFFLVFIPKTIQYNNIYRAFTLY